MAFVFPLHGKQEPVDAINVVMDKISQPPYNVLDVESSDFLGFKVWESKTGPLTPKQARGLYLSATTRGVVVGSNGEQVRDGLRRITGDKASESVLDDQKISDFVSHLPHDGARGFLFTRGDALLKDFAAVARISPSMRDQMPPEEELRKAIGDSWWTLRSKDSTILFTFMSEAPKSAQ